MGVPLFDLDALSLLADSIATDRTGEFEGSGFLRYLHWTLREQAKDLRAEVHRCDDAELRDRVTRLTDELEADAGAIAEAVDESSFDIFDIIEATLGTNHARQLYEFDSLEVEFDGVHPALTQQFGRLREHLLAIDTARKYSRTICVEKELSYFSRVLLYVGVPTEVLTALVLAVVFSFVLRLSRVAQLNTSVAPFVADERTEWSKQD